AIFHALAPCPDGTAGTVCLLSLPRELRSRACGADIGGQERPAGGRARESVHGERNSRAVDPAPRRANFSIVGPDPGAPLDAPWESDGDPLSHQDRLDWFARDLDMLINFRAKSSQRSSASAAISPHDVLPSLLQLRSVMLQE